LKVEAECLLCLLERACRQTGYVGGDRQAFFQVMTELLDMLHKEFTPEAVPAYLGTLRDRIVRKATGRDPYEELKRQANEAAWKVLPAAERFVLQADSDYERFRRLCMVAVAGNSVEFDVMGYSFTLDRLGGELENLTLRLDHLPQAYAQLEASREVLFLTDNAGEIVLDTLLMRYLKQRGLTLTVAVKGSPVLNDATLVDAQEAGVDRIADELITTGLDSVGLILDAAPKPVREKFTHSDLVIAKGMGNYETLTEVKGAGVKVLFLLKAKCAPVARSLGVERGSNAALFLEL
jgi:hypothetical protein